MKLMEYMRTQIGFTEPHGKILAFGTEARSLACSLIQRGWTGVTVCDTAIKPMDGETLIVGLLATDARLVKTIEGHWARSITPGDVFRQFSRKFDIIAAIHTEQDRAIWHNECVFNALPKVYILGEDGHNQEVAGIAKDRGYSSEVVDGCRVLVHS